MRHLRLIRILTLVTVFVVCGVFFIDYYELNQRQRLVIGIVLFPRIATSFFSLLFN